MGFSGVSLGSLIMIGFVGLLVFGPEKLKVLSKELGESIGALKKGLDEGSREKSSTKHLESSDQ